MRILLVEDELEMAAALKTTLRRQDVVVDHASNLADAEAMVRFGAYDAIVLDRRLPDGEGLTLIPRLRALNVEAPVIALTAMSGVRERIAGLDADFAPLAIEAGYDLAFEPPGGKVEVEANSLQIEQALANIIRNAIEHGGRVGVITVAVDRTGGLEVWRSGGSR